MSLHWTGDEGSDPYDDAAREAAEIDAEHDALVREYDAARADLKRITTSTLPRAQRWAIFERFHAAALALEVEADRQHYGAINARIVGEIVGSR